MPVSPEERRERARERARKRRESKRPPQPEPGPIIQEPPNANICWHWAKPRWGQSCRGNHVDDLLIMFGACRADADQWFWSSGGFRGGGVERNGFELSAVRARIKAHEAVVEIADGRLVAARENDDRAAWTLRKLYPLDRPTRALCRGPAAVAEGIKQRQTRADVEGIVPDRNITQRLYGTGGWTQETIAKRSEVIPALGQT